METIEVCDKNSIHSPKLVSVADYRTAVKDAHDITLEVSPIEEYANGHLPNAIHVWRPDFRSKIVKDFNGMKCSAEELGTFLQNIGTSESSIVYLYDNKGGCDAMRLAWVFDFYGFDKYKVINGGKEDWTRSGLLLDTIPYTTDTSQYKFEAQVNTSVLATLSDVKNALDDEHTLLIDTREYYEYEGRPFLKDEQLWPYKKGAFERGCIPGAIHINWSEMSDLANDHKIKCIKDLKYNFETRGVTKDKNIIVYCQSGSRSSHTAFVLREILGYPNVKNYDGSWIEWTYHHAKDKSVPVEHIFSDEEYAALYKKLEKQLNK